MPLLARCRGLIAACLQPVSRTTFICYHYRQARRTMLWIKQLSIAKATGLLKAQLDQAMQRGGLDLAQSFHAIKASSGNSFVHETEGQLVLNGSYNINFTMDLACKDLGFATQLGRDFGVPLEVAGLVEQTFIRARSQYGGGAWSSQVVKLLEDALSTDLRAPGFPSEL